jgi:hypothetical protein
MAIQDYNKPWKVASFILVCVFFGLFILSFFYIDKKYEHLSAGDQAEKKSPSELIQFDKDLGHLVALAKNLNVECLEAKDKDLCAQSDALARFMYNFM